MPQSEFLSNSADVPHGSHESEEVDFLTVHSDQHTKMHERLECLENVPEPEPPNFIWGNEVPGDVFCNRADRVMRK